MGKKYFWPAILLSIFAATVAHAEPIEFPAAKTETDPMRILKELKGKTEAPAPACDDASKNPSASAVRSVSERLCASLGDLKSVSDAPKNAIKSANELFLAGLDPSLKTTIHGPEDLMKYIRDASNALPSGPLRNDPWTPENVKIIAQKYPEYAETKKKFFKMVRDYEAALYQASNVNSEAPEYNISPAYVEKRSHEIAETLLKEIKTNGAFTNEDRERITERLRGVRVLTAASFVKEPDSMDGVAEYMLFLMACGPKDLSVPNAYAAPLPKYADLIQDKNGQVTGLREGAKLNTVFLVCPALGTAVSGLARKSLGLDFILAHELSHIVTFASEVKGITAETVKHPQGLDLGLFKAHSKLLSCLEKGFSRQFRTPIETMALLQPIYDQQIKTDPLASFFSREGMLISQARSIHTKLTEFLGHEPTGTESHATELLADYWATRVTAPLAAATKGLSFEKAAASYMALFCSMQSTTTEQPTDGDESLHPSFRFRIENFLRNPALREDGKKSDAVQKLEGDWCDL